MKNEEDRSYTLSALEAASLAGTSMGQIIDLVRVGALPVLTFHRPGGKEWFNVADVEQLRELLSENRLAVDHLRTLHVGEALRVYLSERTPTLGYDDALASRAALLRRSRDGKVFAHVQPVVVADFVRDHHPEFSGALFAGAVRDVIIELGGILVRGLRDRDTSKQRWHSWYRLPQSFWSPDPLLADAITWRPMREDIRGGDTVGLARGSEPFLRNVDKG